MYFTKVSNANDRKRWQSSRHKHDFIANVCDVEEEVYINTDMVIYGQKGIFTNSYWSKL